ncbi:uncharacterized protein YkuJ [Bacillus pakistanensis]|uniref:Uncharacterized protein YkuJ n=1 Tax=Rossellomorea pakistanensis TaxID=992288 RepID=A0ABS2NFP6_9BACI|nr:YkuJ family protein [Bacillus pakistanensis]MBM7586643.1 uncharacterized protein YkuJ [Bacillus pakistanensis]
MSQLLGIIQRLKTLQDGTDHSETNQRFFEINGKKICQVTYMPTADTFELEVYKDDKKPNKYPFDDIDMTAIEIFDLLQENHE